MIRGNELSEISLFDDKNVLTLESDVGNQSPEFGPRLVYIGLCVFDLFDPRLVYIQRLADIDETRQTCFF